MRKTTRKSTSMDVAREAGVSQSTVSYVLSGSKRADRFSPGTRRRIIEAADLLGYRRDSVGAALRRGYSDTLVVLTVTWVLANSHSDTIMSLSRAAASHGLSTIVDVAADSQEAIAFLDNLSSLNPFGLLMLWDSNAIPMDKLRELHDAGLPVVDLLPAAAEGLVSVTIDREMAFYSAVRHLVDLGHENIGLIYNTRGTRTGCIKLAGYKRGLESAGIKFRQSRVQEVSGVFFDSGAEGLERLLRTDPSVTGVVCGADPQALGAILAARDMGLGVPGDISIVGFGDQMGGGHFRPSLTALAVPPQKMAEDAVNILMRMRREEDFEPVSVNEPAELIVRASSGPVRSASLSTRPRPPAGLAPSASLG